VWRAKKIGDGSWFCCCLDMHEPPLDLEDSLGMECRGFFVNLTKGGIFRPEEALI